MDEYKLTNTEDLKYEGFAWERKYDGTFAEIEITDGEVCITGKGKRGHEYSEMFPDVCADLTDFDDGKYRAEIVQWEEGAVKERFDWIQPRTSSKSDYQELADERPCGIVLFDILDVGDSYHVRREHLEALDLSGRRIMLSENALSRGQMDEMMEKIEDFNLEGIVMKSLDGKRDFKWKPVFTEDVVWEGKYIEGKGQHAGKVGSLVCWQWVDGEKVEITFGGFTLKDRDMFTEMAKDFKSPICMEVKHSEYLASGQLRWARYKCLREDKTPADCVRRVE